MVTVKHFWVSDDGRAFLIPKVHKEVIMKEIQRLCDLGWDYVREIDSREVFCLLSTIETSLRLSSPLFGLQNSDYIRLNRQKFAKK